MNEVISRTITNLRFPLMLTVVLSHNLLINPTDAINHNLFIVAFVVELMSYRIVAPCVPLFFFISGYLFFLKFADKFSAVDYRVQMKKRVRTLLIPYVFWNLVVLCCFAIIHRFVPSLINPEFNNVYTFSIDEWIRSFWNFPGGQPICYQFWFLRDLLVIVTISPIIFIGIRFGTWYLMLLLVTLYIYDPNLFPHQGVLTFFSLGAGCAIHRYDFVSVSSKCVKIAAPLFGVLVIIASLRSDWWGHGFAVVSGSILYIWIASKLKLINRKFADSGFFIYAFHGFPILVLGRAIVSALHPNSTVMWLLCYAGCFVLIVFLAFSLYIILKTKFPQFLGIITGGR